MEAASFVADPPNFIWGSATASYQVEGGYKEGGRGPSIWDTFSHIAGNVDNNDTGDVADDHYHRFREDISLMSDMGIENYRMSIAWPRLMPDGATLNQDGIDFYNTLIDSLLDAGIEPLVTLYHWDLPQAIEDELTPTAWANSTIEERFVNYADAAFGLFGDRVKSWLTFNEPLTFCVQGYSGAGVHAPGRCSDRESCEFGDDATEPYLCSHNVLNSHAAAYRLYDEKYRAAQGGRVGITLNGDWAQPLDPESEADLEASNRAMEFQRGWYADPIYFGDYPESMRERAGDRLPTFTEEQSERLRGSTDFFGFNHYTSSYATPSSDDDAANGEGEQQVGWSTDMGVTRSHTDADGNLIGEQASSSWLFVVPYGIEMDLKWVYDRYGDEIIVTENGVDVPGEADMTLDVALNDTFRVNFYSDYISHAMKAAADGVNLGGYFAWSFMDNFEWADGYSNRFGLHYVDFDGKYGEPLERYPKASAKWFAKRIAEGGEERL